MTTKMMKWGIDLTIVGIKLQSVEPKGFTMLEGSVDERGKTLDFCRWPKHATIFLGVPISRCEHDSVNESTHAKACTRHATGFQSRC